MLLASKARRVIILPFLLLPILSLSTYSKANGQQALVKVAEVQANEHEQSVWRSGMVVSRHDALVASRISGQVTWLKEEGDLVKHGEPLLKIDDAQLQLDAKQQTAQIRQLQAELSFLSSDVKRLKALEAKNNASKTLLEQRVSEQAAMQARLDSAQALLEKINHDISYAQLAAPYSGVVTERRSQIGEVVNIGTPVLRLVDIENKDIQVMVPLTSWQFVKPGMSLVVRSALGVQTAQVRKAVPVGETRTRLMEVLINAEQLDWPVGLDVEVAIPLPKLDHAARFLVPRDALVLRKGQTSVFVIDDDNIAHQIAVVESTGYGQAIAVAGKLTVGQKVIIRGAERLRDGMPVNVIGDSQGLVKVKGV